jgi:hypothetical protein
MQCKYIYVRNNYCVTEKTLNSMLMVINCCSEKMSRGSSVLVGLLCLLQVIFDISKN